jgi:formaldehyde-activating enzyme involved in methanogenesis
MGAAESVFDGNSFMAILEEKTDKELSNIIPVSKYVTKDSMLFNKLYIRTQYFYGACKVTAKAANDARNNCDRLLKLLKMKYAIKDTE